MGQAGPPHGFCTAVVMLFLQLQNVRFCESESEDAPMGRIWGPRPGPNFVEAAPGKSSAHTKSGTTLQVRRQNDVIPSQHLTMFRASLWTLSRVATGPLMALLTTP